jgi:hypothetical protein
LAGVCSVGSKIHTKKKGTSINFIAIWEKLNSFADAETEVHKELLEIQFWLIHLKQRGAYNFFLFIEAILS